MTTLQCRRAFNSLLVKSLALLPVGLSIHTESHGQVDDGMMEAPQGEPMGLPYAEFLGVRIMEADKRSIYAACIKAGVNKNDLSPKSTKETITFPANTFPGGIVNVEFNFLSNGRMIDAVAKVPMNKAWERKKERDDRYNSVYMSIANKYGQHNFSNNNKTEFGTYPRFYWMFDDDSSIILQHNGPIYGMDLMYINVELWKSKKKAEEARKKGNL